MADKPLPITKRMVWEAYKLVEGNGKAAGVDGQSLEAFAGDLANNLYKLWNRLASGSYFPPPVRRVEIPKSGGGVRPLGIPTVADRVAQMVIKQYLEPGLDGIFDPDSYGYRPGKSAHQAVEQTRKRCWSHDWVLDLDIKGFFDTIDHDLLMRALRKHCQEDWVLLYIDRWLKAPVQLPNGQLEERTRGTPQGGVVSPLLANLFLHYAFDTWMRRDNPAIPFERYADDVICHCRSRQEAEGLKAALEQRLADCHLTLHPEKTCVVYCKDSNRRGSHPLIQFTFLGFAFRPRMAKNRWGRIFTCFLPAVSPQALKRMRDRIRSWRLPQHAPLPLVDIARMINPVLDGWWRYYGRFYPTEMWKLFTYFDERLGAWLRKKHKQYKGHCGRSLRRLNSIAKRMPGLFVHWTRLGHATVG
ncbi:group II intron reverse transcriptase/maturase [Paracoccus liaowanqingii]|uniref:RNA-directed DNA polymerase n=1 Tax=Paracoccus liaowanqingii TaxID=2560053 RepID=A0A4Z1BL96_9RHOB|nr:group II intron reverse transcriptase/maturase [Paracoccus liaowanqingii]TGN37623.1 group II intron reverse transcriptase/maturase [Paracoccus liaowanqingii]